MGTRPLILVPRGCPHSPQGCSTCRAHPAGQQQQINPQQRNGNTGSGLQRAQVFIKGLITPEMLSMCFNCCLTAVLGLQSSQCWSSYSLEELQRAIASPVHLFSRFCVSSSSHIASSPALCCAHPGLCPSHTVLHGQASRSSSFPKAPSFRAWDLQ